MPLDSSFMNFYFYHYRHFRIHVIPLELKLVNSSSIGIQQGLRMAHITSKNLGSKTNGQRALTFFNITRGPEGGLIYMNDAPASVFGQVDIHLFLHYLINQGAQFFTSLKAYLLSRHLSIERAVVFHLASALIEHFLEGNAPLSGLVNQLRRDDL